MQKGRYAFSAEVWLYPGAVAPWHFITVPKKLSAEIKAKHGKSARGWGSLLIAATIRKSTWKTSIFPDKKSAAYLLPVKAEVRKKEGMRAGNRVKVGLSIRA